MSSHSTSILIPRGAVDASFQLFIPVPIGSLSILCKGHRKVPVGFGLMADRNFGGVLELFGRWAVLSSGASGAAAVIVHSELVPEKSPRLYRAASEMGRLFRF